MEISPRRRRKESMGEETFSFRQSPDDNFEFETCQTGETAAYSLSADELFSNGRLLPHSFPLRHASRTSSSSLLSSRSNSVGSNSTSASASARSSDASDHRRPTPPLLLRRQISANKGNVSARVYGSSQRWQFMAAPPLTRDGSRRRSPAKEKRVCGGDDTYKRKKKKKKRRSCWRIGRRILRWFVSACKECHAIEPRPKKM